MAGARIFRRTDFHPTSTSQSCVKLKMTDCQDRDVLQAGKDCLATNVIRAFFSANPQMGRNLVRTMPCVLTKEIFDSRANMPHRGPSDPRPTFWVMEQESVSLCQQSLLLCGMYMLLDENPLCCDYTRSSSALSIADQHLTSRHGVAVVRACPRR